MTVVRNDYEIRFMGKELLCQIMADSEGRRSSTILDASFIEDARQMIGHRAFADH